MHPSEFAESVVVHDGSVKDDPSQEKRATERRHALTDVEEAVGTRGAAVVKSTGER